MSLKEVYFEGPPPWGFRMTGGVDTGHSLRISRVNPGSKAEAKGLREGDLITTINGQSTKCLTNSESHALLRSIKENLHLGLNEDKTSSPRRRSKEIKLTQPSATAGDKGESTVESKEPSKRRQKKSRHSKKRTFKGAIKSLFGYRETEGQIINLHPTIPDRKSEECDSIGASTLPDDNTSQVYYDNLRENGVNGGDPSENGSTRENPSFVSKNSDCSEVIRILDKTDGNVVEPEMATTPTPSPVKPKTVTFGQSQVCEVSFHHCDSDPASFEEPGSQLIECKATEVIEFPEPDEIIDEHQNDTLKPATETVDIHWPSFIKVVAPPAIHHSLDNNHPKKFQPVFINPRRYLEAISEESSDLSDSGKTRDTGQFKKPSNHFDRIPEDWYGSNEGIDTSWQEGKSLEEVSDVPIVSDSHSDSDVLIEDTVSMKNHRVEKPGKKPFQRKTLPSTAVVKNVVSSYYNSVNPLPSPVHLETVQKPRPLSGPISEVVEIVYIDSSDSEVNSKSEADYSLDAFKESDQEDFGDDFLEKFFEITGQTEKPPEQYDSRSIPESTISSSSRATSKFSNSFPLTLRELGVLAVLKMPDGASLLKELGLEYIDTDQYSGYVAECSENSCSSVQFNSEKEQDCDIISERDLIFDHFSGSFPWIEEFSQNAEDKQEETQPTSSTNSNTSDDRSSKKSKDIACILDLHCKFSERRGYFEPENLIRKNKDTVEIEFIEEEIDPSTALKKYHEMRQQRMKQSNNCGTGKHNSGNINVSPNESIKDELKKDADELVGNSRLLDLIQSIEGKSSNGESKLNASNSEEPIYVNVENKPPVVTLDTPNKSSLLIRRHSDDNINVALLSNRRLARRSNRPRSLPPPGEILRRRMYDEYMDKLAAMSERRQMKVVKLSKCPQDTVVGHEIGSLEKEFMGKVKERNLKLGLENEETDDERNDGVETPFPKHIRELMDQSDDRGIWSPAQTPEAERKKISFADIEIEESKDNEPQDAQPPIWIPKSIPSPTLERKFRSVNFQSPPPKRKEYQSSSEKKPELPKDLPIEINRSTKLSSSASENSLSSPLRLPSAQNPTITLLQKAREGEIPKGAHYLDDIPDRSESKLSPNEIIYSVKKEYSTVDEEGVKKVVELTPRKFVGIGPTTKEGIPIGLRSEVKEDNQQKWYKRMYDSLHKADHDKDYVTVRYKTKRKGQYPYSYAGGYASEPERLNYDSDASLSKYATLDRRKIRNKESDFTSSTLPRNKYGPDVKHAVNVYKNQPGRIENYEPGHSSISEIEKKQWWDEVLDIFNGEINQQGRNLYSQDYRTSSYSHKDAGYDSDSTLVFKRRDDMSQTLSPAEQKMAYKVIQRGGEVPLHGLRKTMPDRPKEPIGKSLSGRPRDCYSRHHYQESPHRYVESEVNIHYKTPVRNEAKVAWPEEELAEKQAEIMRRIYQEQRRTKYLNELHDMYSRRHTDNFIPSQKSPIPLNRYDDFPLEPQPPRPRDRTPEPKLVARALYNFVGQSPKELSFRKGDIIYVRRQIDKNWYEGEHNAMIGLFPFNYVEIVPYDGIRSLPRKASEGQARAKFNFQAQTHLELSLVKGELVLLTRRVDENWFEGRIGNRKGIFPVSYVEVLVEPGERALSPSGPISSKPIVAPASHSVMLNGAKDLGYQHYQPPRPALYSSSSLPSQSRLHDVSMMSQSLHIETQSDPIPYRVLYNYRPQNDDELELKEGDVVYVMEKCDDGWYVGSLHRNGQFGTFPGNYVERITP